MAWFVRHHKQSGAARRHSVIDNALRRSAPRQTAGTFGWRVTSHSEDAWSEYVGARMGWPVFQLNDRCYVTLFMP